MILVSDAPGGLYLSRSGRADPPLFVAESEIAATIAEMTARALGGSYLETWDAYAALCGNDGSEDAAVLA